MHHMIAWVLVAAVLIANCIAVSVSPLRSGDVNRYCQFKRRTSPKISGEDLLVSIMLNSGEMISIFPDEEGLSGYYKFSAKDKDAYVADFLNGTNAAACCESLRSKIKGVSGSKFPESCSMAMTRLGLEEEFNRRYVGAYYVCFHDKMLVATNNHLAVSFTLSKVSEVCDVIEDFPIKVDVGGSEVGVDDGAVMLRGENYFYIAERSPLTHMSVVYLSSGAIRVNVVLSGLAASELTKVTKLLCYIPHVGVYGVDF